MELKLDDWQIDLINDESQYLLLCKGRQIGGTSAFAEKAVKWMIEKKSRIIVGSITEDQAKLVIVMVENILRDKHSAMIKKGKEKPTQDRIRLKNGAEIRSRPVGPKGDAFRGFTADVNWFNEASQWPELAFVAMTPTLLTTGGSIWMDSTPFGKKGFFWNSFENKQKLWKVYYKNSEDVTQNRPVSDTWTAERREKAIRFLNDRKAELSTLLYGQEFLGLFLDDIQRFYTEELVEKACILERSPETKGKNYLGIDVARLGGDHNAYQFICDTGKEYRHIESISHPGKLTPETERDIVIYSELFNCRKMGLDAGSGTLGVSIYDHLRETKIRYRILAMNNRAISMTDDGKRKQTLMKEDYHENLKSMLEHGELLLLNDEAVKRSLRSVIVAFVMKNDEPTKKEIFSNPHSESHIVEALKLAAWLAKKEKTLNLEAFS